MSVLSFIELILKDFVWEEKLFNVDNALRFQIPNVVQQRETHTSEIRMRKRGTIGKQTSEKIENWVT